MQEKNLPWNWDLHEDCYCLISREMVAHFCEAADGGWCSRLRSASPDPEEGAQDWAAHAAQGSRDRAMREH